MTSSQLPNLSVLQIHKLHSGVNNGNYLRELEWEFSELVYTRKALRTVVLSFIVLRDLKGLVKCRLLGPLQLGFLAGSQVIPVLSTKNPCFRTMPGTGSVLYDLFVTRYLPDR